MAHDAYVIDAVRTPVGRLGGALATVRPDDLAAGTLRALIGRSPWLDPATIDEVYLGAANQAGEDNRNVARMAVLLAGLPTSIPGATMNRLCGSGLEAIIGASRALTVGDADVARRRRRREHEPGAVDPAEAGARLPHRPRAAVEQHARVADGESGHAGGVDRVARRRRRGARRRVLDRS